MKNTLNILNFEPLTEKEKSSINGGVVGVVIAVIALAITSTTAVGYTVGRLTRED